MARKPLIATDQATRDRALDPTGSFIVQAPAGSGKTGLLIQRYLTLLARVDHPEEVVAVTFTRKAAIQMRNRILTALEDTKKNLPPTNSPFEHRTRILAEKAMARDDDQGWEILFYPARLRIRTIDSLCASIIAQTPWSSRLGGESRTMEDAEPFYRQAVNELLEILEDQGPWADAVAQVLTFLDNDLTKFQATLTRMLARRDQWLRHLIHEDDLESRHRRMSLALEHIVGDDLTRLLASVPKALSKEIVTLADYAGNNLVKTDSTHLIAVLAGLDSFPRNNAKDIPLWRGIAELLLKKDGTWRSRYTRKEGFPPAQGKNANIKAAMKARIEELQEKLSTEDTFRIQLRNVRELPTPVYGERQWAVLDALGTVLHLATAVLRVVFARHGVVDFIEVSHGTLTALGEDDAPTDLALSLDYRIRHLLVDEFQDTSHTQVLLFTRLTAGWQPGDGRTLFLVGDPMQSIYRFREADVGLYLRARKYGIGNISLESLTLSVNFRSQSHIVTWINQVFSSVFPNVDDASTGAVGFHPSIAHKHPDISQAPTPSIIDWLHLYRKDYSEQEAEQIVALIQALREENPEVSIAIIVRSRNHLDTILPQLRIARIPYRGVEIEPLIHQPVVQDLLALTRALLHPGDRIAWLSVLRAPWCGLTLHDLYALAADDHHAPILEQLRDLMLPTANSSPFERLPTIHPERKTGLDDLQSKQTSQSTDRSSQGKKPLTPDGRSRLQRVFPILDSAVRHRARNPLRTIVEEAWMALGGMACISDDEMSNAKDFFSLLETLEDESDSPDGHWITDKTSQLYATPNVEGWHVEIMTIHKAKGLEFDSVIVPGLGRGTRPTEKPLLAWTEYPTATDEFDPVLAPMTAPREPEDPIYRYLSFLEETKTDWETARLLYVAATRARRHLHLLGETPVSEKTDEPLINRRSLLGHLWPAISSAVTAFPTYLNIIHTDTKQDSTAEDQNTSTSSHLSYPRTHVGIHIGLTNLDARAWKPTKRPDRENFSPTPPTQPEDIETDDASTPGPHRLWRLPADWLPPAPPEPLPPPASLFPNAVLAEIDMEPVEFSWAGHTARSIGIVVHRILRYLAEEKNAQQKEVDVIRKTQTEQASWRATLLGFGVPEDQVEPAVEQIGNTVRRILKDPRWHWIIDPSHSQAHNEYPLTGLIEGRLVNGVIDRTFVDKEGTRWIIDYKTGSHEGGHLDQFLDQEQARYRAQLELYANLLANMESRPTRMGLYFPLLGGWRSWWKD